MRVGLWLKRIRFNIHRHTQIYSSINNQYYLGVAKRHTVQSKQALLINSLTWKTSTELANDLTERYSIAHISQTSPGTLGDLENGVVLQA